MKRYFTPLLCLLFLASIGHAQKNKRQENRDKIKSLKIAYITEQLNLTADEAQKFWPLYNAHEEVMVKSRALETRIMRKRFLEKEGFKSYSKEESNKMLDDLASIEKEIFESKQKFRKQLQKVIPAEKILKLEFAERTFKQKMLQRLKRSRGRKDKE